MKSYSSHVSKRQPTAQTVEVIGKAQVKNNAGGFVFAVTPEEQFKRFLILGSEGGTYYVGEHALTVENAKNAIAFIKSNGPRAVKLISEISDEGRAPKNDPAIFALALACTYGDQATKNLAYQAVPTVCRIGTHIFHFCQAVQDLRGWSRGLRKAVARFYTTKQVKDVAYGMVKYRQRDNWTHRDVLRLAHPEHPEMSDMFRYAVGKEVDLAKLPAIIAAYEEAKTCDTTRLIKLIKDFNLSREMVPTDKLNTVTVWEALLDKMPLTAMIRNLGKMTQLGILKGNTEWTKRVVSTLSDREALKKARIHPLGVLIALKTYGMGHGLKGDLAWTVTPQIVDALDEALGLSFSTVEATGKRFLLGLDVSGSMGSCIAGAPVSCCEASAVMALATAKAEDDYTIMGFAGPSNFRELGITKKTTFIDAAKRAHDNNFGSTDCSGAILYALKHKLKVDVFAVYTDNETYAGSIHPFQALQQYRKETGIRAKLVVAGMTSSGFTIADPSDSGMMDVVGFDTTAPAVISEFARQ
jgi:60 kDa SS-A/Ro ribonucleoprotein